MTHISQTGAGQKGATLIEVLIAMIILSVGLLGLAGLQATSVQANHSAYYRSQATLLASDLTDRMRSNRTAALGNDYVFTFPTSSSTNAVTGTQAEKDRAEWLNMLASRLPSGTGQVQKTGSLITISIKWDDNRGAIKKDDNTETPSPIFVYRTAI